MPQPTLYDCMPQPLYMIVELITEILDWEPFPVAQPVQTKSHSLLLECFAEYIGAECGINYPSFLSSFYFDYPAPRRHESSVVQSIFGQMNALQNRYVCRFTKDMLTIHPNRTAASRLRNPHSLSYLFILY